jgi:hypothetical protein
MTLPHFTRIMYKIKQILEALAPFDPDMDVRVRFYPAMSELEADTVTATVVSYVELTLHYYRPVANTGRKSDSRRPHNK